MGRVGRPGAHPRHPSAPPGVPVGSSPGIFLTLLERGRFRALVGMSSPLVDQPFLLLRALGTEMNPVIKGSCFKPE